MNCKVNLTDSKNQLNSLEYLEVFRQLAIILCNQFIPKKFINHKIPEKLTIFCCNFNRILDCTMSSSIVHFIVITRCSCLPLGHMLQKEFPSGIYHYDDITDDF